MDRYPLLKTYRTVWAYSNMGILWGTRRTRREAIEEVERITGDPWSVAKKNCEVRKCEVIPL